jgi:hypothetical protein
MLRVVKNMRAPRMAHLQKRSCTNKIGTIRIIEFDPEDMKNHIKESNAGITQTIARNERLICLLQGQKSVGQELINKNKEILRIIESNTNKDYIEIPDVRRLHALMYFFE